MSDFEPENMIQDAMNNGDIWDRCQPPPPVPGSVITDTDRLNFIIDLIYQEGTSGLIDMKWSNPAEDDSMEADDSIFDRACIDAAIIKAQNTQGQSVGA
jgi:hypothetical protein